MDLFSKEDSSPEPKVNPSAFVYAEMNCLFKDLFCLGLYFFNSILATQLIFQSMWTTALVGNTEYLHSNADMTSVNFK